MGQALYRKYRSKSLSEIVGQEHITETLDKAVKSGKISHAYLFTGPRGVGKTSIARILAHQVNGLPYDDDSQHMDIIEIDAASNRRIDEIRELRDKVAVAPTSAKYKVYIIDEVHMLTKEAFNALLKTLEEPPAHVIFILATTDAHKLPATIVSRTQRYTFKPVARQQVVDHLRHIAAAENIKADDAALELLATHGEGSFRDSISMLDQASGHGANLTLTFVHTLLGIPPDESMVNILSALRNRDANGTVRHLTSVMDAGFQPAAIAKILGQKIRSELLNGESALDKASAYQLMSRLLDVPTSHDPARLLEIILIDGASTDEVGSHVAKVKTPVVVPNPPIIRDVAPPATITEPAAAKEYARPRAFEKVKEAPQAEAALDEHSTVEGVESKHAQTANIVDAAIWPDVLHALKQKYNTLYGVVRMAVPTFEGKHLELAFGFSFHQKRLSDPKNKKILADIIFDLSGQAVQITCVVQKDTAPAVSDSKSSGQTAPDLGAISDIFGGAEII